MTPRGSFGSAPTDHQVVSPMNSSWHVEGSVSPRLPTVLHIYFREGTLFAMALRASSTCSVVSVFCMPKVTSTTS